MQNDKRVGLMLWPAPGLGAGFEFGATAESMGYDDIWLPDSEGLQDPIALAAALGVATKHIRIGTAIVPVFNRPMPVLATGVVAAEQRAPGRFVLGLGSSTANMVNRWYGLPYEKPLTRVRESIEMMRGILRGEKTRFHGETVDSEGFILKERPSGLVPIFVGAMGPRMMQLAGEVGDGVILNDFTPEDRLDWAFSQIEIGLRRAGRQFSDIEIVKRRAIFATDDNEVALDHYRRTLGFYGAAPAYQEVMLRLGYDTAIEEIRAGYQARDRTQIAAAINDDMIKRLFAFGTPGDLRGTIQRDFDQGIDTIIVSPQGDSAERFLAGAQAFGRENFPR